MRIDVMVCGKCQKEMKPSEVLVIKKIDIYGEYSILRCPFCKGSPIVYKETEYNIKIPYD